MVFSYSAKGQVTTQKGETKEVEEEEEEKDALPEISNPAAAM